MQDIHVRIGTYERIRYVAEQNIYGWAGFEPQGLRQHTRTYTRSK